MPERVFTDGDPNIQAFTAATAHLQTERAMTQQERELTQAARLALPGQVAGVLNPAVAAALAAASDALQRAGILGAYTTEAELIGKPAGSYRVGAQYVAWSGTAVTSRTAVLADAESVDLLKTATNNVREQVVGVQAQIEIAHADLLAGTASVPASVGRIFDEQGTLELVPSASVPAPDNVLSYAIPGGRTAVRVDKVVKAVFAANRQAAISAASAKNLLRVDMSGLAPLTEELHVVSDMHLVGTDMSDWIYRMDVTDSTIKSNLNISRLLTVKMQDLVGDGLTANVGAFSTTGLSWRGGFTIADDGAEDGIYTDGVLGPGRPFKVSDSSFKFFNAALRFDQRKSGAHPRTLPNGDITTDIYQTSWYTMPITGNTFTGNVYAIHAEGWSPLGGLWFANNVSEGGGRIYAGLRGTFGYIGLLNNLMEGQSDPITMGSGLGTHWHLVGQYFEGNPGLLYNLVGDEFRRSSLRMHSNYVDGAAPNTQRTIRLRAIFDIEIAQPNMLVRGSELRIMQGARRVRGWLPDYAGAGSFGGAGESFNWILSQPHEQFGALGDSTLFAAGGQLYQTPTLVTRQTPLGFYQAFSSGRHVFPLAATSGQIAIISVLARTTDGSSRDVAARVTDDLETIGFMDIGPRVPLTPDWQVLTINAKITQNVTGLGFNLPGTGIEWTAAYAGTIPTEDTPYQIHYPPGAAAGVGAFQPRTTVGRIVVNPSDTAIQIQHGLPAAPTGIFLQPHSANAPYIGGYSATEFTVVNPAGATAPYEVAWTAMIT